MPEEILRLKPDQVVRMIKQGEMAVITPLSPPENFPSADGSVERARNILGKDFLGVEAVKNMADKLKAVGVNVEFPLDNLPPFPYSEKDIELAKQNGEMVVVRPSKIRIGNVGADLTLINFRDRFQKDPVGSIQTLFYSFRRDTNDWYKGEDFAAKPGEMQLGWAIVKKELLPSSTNKNWQQQEDAIREYGNELRQQGATSTPVRRRNATEATWDTMLYYTNNKEQLLGSNYEWTSSRASDGHLVIVGGFGSGGLGLSNWNPSNQNPSIGVCPSR